MSTLSPTTLTIEELEIPRSTTDPHFAAFDAMVALRNEIETATIGTDVLNISTADILPTYLDADHSPRRVFVARIGDQIVGRSLVEWSTEEGATAAWPTVEVLPAFRNRGIGTEMLRHIEAQAQLVGARTLQHSSIHTPLEGGERILSPTGHGDVPAADPGVRFLVRAGYALEQVFRISILDLPIREDDLTSREHAAVAAAGPDYRVHRWTGRTPERWLDDMAILRNRMSVDAPSAGLEITEETWDAERVWASEEHGEVSDRLVLTAAVEHIPSGRLAGFSQIHVPSERTRPASQEDTLVIREHRGHRLGMLLKVTNLRFLIETNPDSPMVTTFNAAENRHMLAVNEALGFRTAGYEGMWKKVVNS
ncbi:MAG TPA: GNAT family N-acetyltransferase [Thermomicrobiales bacterium]|jgi:GNAT superfamily N-acetyltransferase|nr:GNAT family N-acetyltransferase [Thermomicrobiales bacterium]